MTALGSLTFYYRRQHNCQQIRKKLFQPLTWEHLELINFFILCVRIICTVLRVCQQPACSCCLCVSVGGAAVSSDDGVYHEKEEEEEELQTRGKDRRREV